MITYKTKEEIEILREGGRRLATVLYAVRDAVRSGVTTCELDALASALILQGGDKPAFLDYQPVGASHPFPAALCVSVNDEVVHGIPGDRVLEKGDIVGIDLGLIHKGLITDMAMTVPVGPVEGVIAELLRVTNKALKEGIKAARVGSTTGDIGHAIENFVSPYGYGVVRELSGHGVGYRVHEPPMIPNYGRRGKGAKLKAGMVIALEPMMNMGKRDVHCKKDGYTIVTNDGSWSAHFEHTIAITEGGPILLTEK